MIQLIELSYTFLLSIYSICTWIIYKLVFLIFITFSFLWWCTVERESLWIAAFVHMLVSLHWMSSRLNYSTSVENINNSKHKIQFRTLNPPVDLCISCLSWFETILDIKQQSFPVTFSVPSYSCCKWYSHRCAHSDLSFPVITCLH